MGSCRWCRRHEGFADQLRQGFGPAKGFGCGLMLVRRA
ncbi:MAG: type I-E CRISPR-associated protein Cas6/Cse3/CasE [Deltaproteobacteria bacterium]|nr:type I-E CRISPR-associated protein Cas6/Cse3/CasE [Deltaproteobacteria bacterium]